MFILPSCIIASYITGTPIPDEWRIELSRYLFNLQRQGGPGDGGWGMCVVELHSLRSSDHEHSHFEGISTVFGTVLNYVVLRILGVDADHAMMIKARATIHKHGAREHTPRGLLFSVSCAGGTTHIPSWGKFWLSCLGVYEWEGLNPIPPELLCAVRSVFLHAI
jgi:lanosterol synthase